MKIWNKQSVSSAFMREIEIVTKMTNDFICDSNGVIVTEYCKKSVTWEHFRDTIEYRPSQEFLRELVSTAKVKDVEQAAKNEKKEENDLQSILKIVNRGVEYWKCLVKTAQDNRITPTFQDHLYKWLLLAWTRRVSVLCSSKNQYGFLGEKDRKQQTA